MFHRSDVEVYFIESHEGQHFRRTYCLHLQSQRVIKVRNEYKEASKRLCLLCINYGLLSSICGVEVLMCVCVLQAATNTQLNTHITRNFIKIIRNLRVGMPQQNIYEDATG
jgi:hypothetical protein